MMPAPMRLADPAVTRRLLALSSDEVALLVRALDAWAYWEGSDEGDRRDGVGWSPASERAYALAETLRARFADADAA